MHSPRLLALRRNNGTSPRSATSQRSCLGLKVTTTCASGSQFGIPNAPSTASSQLRNAHADGAGFSSQQLPTSNATSVDESQNAVENAPGDASQSSSDLLTVPVSLLSLNPQYRGDTVRLFWFDPDTQLWVITSPAMLQLHPRSVGQGQLIDDRRLEYRWDCALIPSLKAKSELCRRSSSDPGRSLVTGDWKRCTMHAREFEARHQVLDAVAAYSVGAAMVRSFHKSTSQKSQDRSLRMLRTIDADGCRAVFAMEITTVQAAADGPSRVAKQMFRLNRWASELTDPEPHTPKSAALPLVTFATRDALEEPPKPSMYASSQAPRYSADAARLVEVDVLPALQHYCWERSGHRYTLVAHLHKEHVGVIDSFDVFTNSWEGKGTDAWPFGSRNKGPDGIEDFMQGHRCTVFCKLLALPPMKSSLL